MAKSKIVKELVNGEISLETALNRTKLIVSDLNNKELSGWLDSEILGYGEKKVPKYRELFSQDIKYSGFNGSYKVTNLDLTIGAFPSEVREDLLSFDETRGVSVIECLIQGDDKIGRSLTHGASLVYAQTGIRCTNICQYLDKTQYIEILSNIKNILIDILLKLEKEFGVLDDLDINVETKQKKELQKINQFIVQLIFDDDSIKIGNNNKLKNANIGSEINED